MPDTTIPEAAVEAAAAADYEHIEGTPWADAHPGDRADWLESHRVALAAAASILMATAWDQGFRASEQVLKQVYDGGWDRPERDDDVPEIDHTKNPYRKDQP